MKKLTVKNPKIQAKLDSIHGIREAILVIATLALTIWMITRFVL